MIEGVGEQVKGGHFVLHVSGTLGWDGLNELSVFYNTTGAIALHDHQRETINVLTPNICCYK